MADLWKCPRSSHDVGYWPRRRRTPRGPSCLSDFRRLATAIATLAVRVERGDFELPLPPMRSRACGEGTLPPSAPIVYAKQLLRETAWSLDRVALVTGYGTVLRLTHAFHRHENTTPGVWRSVHGTPAVRKRTPQPDPPWPGVTVTFYDAEGNEMEE